jgi:hypothetical protein
MRSSKTPLLLACALLAGAAACDGGGDGDNGAAGAAGGGGEAAAVGCNTPTEVACADQVFQDLVFNTEVAPGLIQNTSETGGWLSEIDATAGGAFSSNPHAYVYARFTDMGLEKVQIADDASQATMDWDIAFRRYVIRINSGNSGPSCVTASPIPGTPAYDEVTSVPGNLPFRKDEFYSPSCTMIADGSGLASSPATALATFYEYPGCVAMTGNVFILVLADGRNVKLTVTDFYYPDIQDQCDTTGMVPMMDTGSGNIRVRWAFLP